MSVLCEFPHILEARKRHLSWLFSSYLQEQGYRFLTDKELNSDQKILIIGYSIGATELEIFPLRLAQTVQDLDKKVDGHDKDLALSKFEFDLFTTSYGFRIRITLGHSRASHVY